MLIIGLAALLTLNVVATVWHVSRVASLAPGGGTVPADEVRRHIRWGLYVNPDDPRGWVPKQSGVGMTVNFRNQRNAMVFAALLVGSLAWAVALTVAALGLT